MPVLIFCAGFIAAFLVALVVLGRGDDDSMRIPAAVTQRDLAAADMDGFFDAASRGDFAAMSGIGRTLFTPGRKIPDAERVFAGYETSSYPPHTVYAFFTESAEDKVRRVLLTLDENDRVESFMAEEMSIIQ